MTTTNIPATPTIETISTAQIAKFFRGWFELFAHDTNSPDLAMQASLFARDDHLKRYAQQHSDDPVEFYRVIRPWFLAHATKLLESSYWSKDATVPRETFLRLSMVLDGMRRNAVLTNHLVAVVVAHPLR